MEIGFNEALLSGFLQQLLQLMLPLYLLVTNISAFLIFGLDKRRAVQDEWRVPESHLLLLALAGGSLGALAGMYVFRHKIRKAKFYLGIPLMLLLQLALYCFMH